MMATAFLGYVGSPKWFNLNISSLTGGSVAAIFLILVFYTQNLGWRRSRRRKSKVLTYPVGNLNNTRYNKLNNKSIYILNKFSRRLRRHKRKYSTTPFLNKSIETSCSERLNIIIKELGLNPIYVFENLDSENIRKQILNETKGLSGVYMIVNKITKDYYIGSAATNRFYARFSNHVIYFRGIL